MEQRSTFVTVVAWIFIVFSSLFLLEAIMFMVMPVEKLSALMQPAQALKPGDTLYLTFMHGFFLVFAALSAWVLLSSIGLVLRKGWARISFMVILIFNLFFCALYLIVGVFGLVSMPGPGPLSEPTGFARSMMVFMTVGSAVFGGLYGFIFYKLGTAKIKREFLPPPKQG